MIPAPFISATRGTNTGAGDTMGIGARMDFTIILMPGDGIGGIILDPIGTTRVGILDPINLDPGPVFQIHPLLRSLDPGQI